MKKKEKFFLHYTEQMISIKISVFEFSHLCRVWTIKSLIQKKEYERISPETQAEKLNLCFVSCVCKVCVSVHWRVSVALLWWLLGVVGDSSSFSSLSTGSSGMASGSSSLRGPLTAFGPSRLRLLRFPAPPKTPKVRISKPIKNAI